ncbi:exported hypothetical protein [Desulfamplus magnetovallimortis]|uniref:Peptidase C-terminal archaeal/bacterial domain-containing protein n=1 Tax=Desulfamplus magnetovallimortis TaxID=1246637 RepID=A0A1W1H5S4_9BACT|nr:hypothetical protein [Desulfamplus magnetovallimortis]SLM27718.1 exported hypothetical protein [Desulfamplus magnetovallimortis]
MDIKIGKLVFRILLMVSMLSIVNAWGASCFDSPDGYLVLTNEVSHTVDSGTTMVVYGTTGVNNLVIESGARAKLINFPGANVITVRGNSSDFIHSRSGAMVTLQDAETTLLVLPATLVSQTIIFDDQPMELIIDSGTVMLDSQVVEMGIIPDKFESDDTWETASVIPQASINSEHSELDGYEYKQLRNFHSADDEDWVRFYCQGSPKSYRLTVYEAGINCDAAIEIYSDDGETLVKYQDNGLNGEDEAISFSFPTDGIYYARIVQMFEGAFKDESEYSLILEEEQGAVLPSMIYGIVTPNISAYLSTDGRGGALTFYKGYYFMPHLPGTFTITVTPLVPGYKSLSQRVTVNDFPPIRLDFTLLADD